MEIYIFFLFEYYFIRVKRVKRVLPIEIDNLIDNLITLIVGIVKLCGVASLVTKNHSHLDLGGNT